MIKVLAPYVELRGLPIIATLRRVRAANFRGIELYLIGVTPEQVRHRMREADDLDLAVHLHQGWSLDENPSHWYNHALNRLGALPPKGYRVYDQLPEIHDGEQVPIIVYADRIPELDSEHAWWVQTCSTHDGRRHRLPYATFRREVRERNLSVVFDTQHYLEYRLGVRGVSELPRDTARLGAFLTEGWHDLKPHVREIHLADCDPALQDTLGRNLPLGKGILPLREFCQVVKKSGWDGYVVPEVLPWHVAHRPWRLRALLEQVYALFE